MAEDRGAPATPLELVSAVAHDLRPPIAAVRGAVAALRRGTGIDDEARERLLAVIADAAEQLGRMVDDLVAAGSVEAGRLDVELRACDAAGVAAVVVEAARAASSRGSRLALETEPDLAPAAADPGRLRQALASLLDNALRHAGPRSSIAVRVGAAPAGIRISVADDGPGVPDAERDRIFERYGRGRGAAPGSGLGLYLARGLVEAMGGSLVLERADGPGATFTIELPRAP